MSLSFKDFIYLHDVACVRGESHYFYFMNGSSKKLFSCKPTSTKYWKNQPLLISGSWPMPEMSHMPISSAFGLKSGIIISTCIFKYNILQFDRLN